MSEIQLVGSKREVIDAVAASLEQHPEQWTRDIYVAQHTSGIYVWIGNGFFGLSVGSSEPGRWLKDDFLGGVTFVSSFFGWATPWRRRLYRLAHTIPHSADDRNSVSADKIVSALAA